jgi:TRAP-type C4-dicarboxylate transport system permease small subunit
MLLFWHRIFVDGLPGSFKIHPHQRLDAGIFPNANRLAFTWIEELIRYLFIWGVFIGAALVYKMRQHATVDLVTHLIPTKTKAVLEVIVELICIGFFILLLWKGIDMAKVAHLQRSPSLKIHMSYMYSSIVVCSVFCLIHSVHFLTMRLTGRTAENEDNEQSSSGEVHV